MAKTFFNSSDDFEDKCNSTSFPIKTDDWDALIFCKRASASLSAVGCIFTLFVLIFYKRYMQFTQRLIIHLCIAAFLEAIGFFFLDRHATEANSDMCKFQASWLQYCLWAILLWTLFIAINLLFNIMWEKTLKKFEVPFSLCCWGLPFIIMCIPFFITPYKPYDQASHYGPSGPWCWLDKDLIYWKIGLWYGWACLSSLGIFVLIVVKNCKRGTHAIEGALYFNFKWDQPTIIRDLHIIRAHHAVFFFLILVVFPFVNDVYYHIHCDYLFALLLLESLSVPFFGGAVTVSFLLDKSTRYVLHPKVITEMLRRKFKIFDEWLSKERTTSCDTFMIDMFASTTSGDASSRESVNSHFLERHFNTDFLDIIREETSEGQQKDTAEADIREKMSEIEEQIKRQARRNTGDIAYFKALFGSKENVTERRFGSREKLNDSSSKVKDKLAIKALSVDNLNEVQPIRFIRRGNNVGFKSQSDIRLNISFDNKGFSAEENKNLDANQISNHTIGEALSEQKHELTNESVC